MNQPYGKIQQLPFGAMSDGRPVNLFSLENDNGIIVKITNYGGIITQLLVPDKDGDQADIVLGFDSLDQYLGVHPYFGAIIGRYGNRIAKGKFTLDHKTYSLAANNNGNHLHGGLIGFDKVLWEAQTVQDSASVGLKLKYLSPDGEEGYPGNLKLEVLYTLNHHNELGIEYQASTDQPTVLNLTNHTYFNFTACQEDVLNHKLVLQSKAYLPVDESLIPLGKPANVIGTPFDFSQFKTIGQQIGDEHTQLKLGGGYDHCYLLDKEAGTFNFAALVMEPKSGRMMEVFTTEPAVQFYTGNFLDEIEIKGKEGIMYDEYYGFCLETQHYPDSPNQPQFPTTRLDPGEEYTSKTVYKFSIAQ